jgi:hypothetical protein
MKYKKLLLPLLLVIFAIGCKPTRVNNGTVNTGNNLQLEDCGSGPNYYRALQVNPRFRNAANRIEDFTRTFIQKRNKNIANEDRTEDYVIPVVVHVVWTSAEENISMAQIERGIQMLNENYAAMNPAASGIPAAFLPLTGNPHIRFKLAVRDPSCNATDGVLRVQNTGNISLNPIEEADDPLFEQLAHNPVKQLSPAWPMDKYLNLWICRFTGGLNGYSTFPGMPANVDGVVIRHGCMGDNGTAATATLRSQTVPAHEIGHWLNLRHTWGDDDYDPPFTSPFCTQDDGVDDTPLQGARTSSGSCPTFPAVSCENGPDGNMFMNYLDYSSCRFMFSAGQVDRMHATLDGERAAIQASDALIPPAGVPGADLYVQDTPDDVGNQPNNESAVLYVSEDIWVRNNDDGLATQSHQNAVYKTTGSNYVYVRIRNRSCNTASPAATVRLYWANASTGLSWPDPWTGGITSPALMGSQVGMQSTGVIAAGGSQVLRFEWTVPNPLDYAVLGPGMNHFCLLARVEEPGVTLSETTDLWNNVKNNNNIAWKNIAVENAVPGGDQSADFLVGNYSKEDRNVNLEIQTRFEDRAMAGKFRQPVTIDLGDKLFGSWYARNKELIERGAYRDQFIIVNRTIVLQNGNAELKNFLFSPRELQAVKVKLNSRQYTFTREQTIMVDLQQVDAKTGAIIGGERVKFTMLPRRR